MSVFSLLFLIIVGVVFLGAYIAVIKMSIDEDIRKWFWIVPGLWVLVNMPRLAFWIDNRLGIAATALAVFIGLVLAVYNIPLLRRWFDGLDQYQEDFDDMVAAIGDRLERIFLPGRVAAREAAEEAARLEKERRAAEQAEQERIEAERLAAARIESEVPLVS